METAEVLEISREAIFVLLKCVLPIMSIALLVGLIISLFQALTQIQEMTLSFVPKIIAVFVSMLFLFPYLISIMTDFAQSLSERIVTLGS